MSKKGRSSVVLLGLVVSALLLVPLIYFALAARIDPVDEEALNEQIEYLQATAVDSPADLQARFLAERDLDLTFLMPGPEYGINHSGGMAVFDPQDFEGWLDYLEPSEVNGVTVYAVTVSEDPETRYTIFRNSLGEVLSSLAPDQNYYPLAWLAAWRPELYAENADPDTRAWYEALCDPARVSVTFYLLPVESVEDMALARLASKADGRNIGMNMMMGEGLPEPVTNLVIFAFEQVTNGMALGIGWPEEFTNNLEVFACTNLAPTGWYVASTNLSTAGTNSLWWVDTSITSNTESQFYRVGNADQDTDNDGLTDARERMMYGTAEDNADTDGDGMNDGFEIVNGLDAFQDDGMGNPDGDGFVNAEECVKGTDATSATSGGGGAQVRFYYDLDDRLTGAFFATNGATQYGYGAADNIAGVHERRAP
jgi:YD repeat-containing protein